jgi:hypothetical protein
LTVCCNGTTSVCLETVTQMLTESLLYIFLDLFGVGTTIDVDLFNTRVCEKLEGVFDKWSVRQRQQTLSSHQLSIHSRHSSY